MASSYTGDAGESRKDVRFQALGAVGTHRQAKEKDRMPGKGEIGLLFDPKTIEPGGIARHKLLDGAERRGLAEPSRTREKAVLFRALEQLKYASGLAGAQEVLIDCLGEVLTAKRQFFQCRHIPPRDPKASPASEKTFPGGLRRSSSEYSISTWGWATLVKVPKLTSNFDLYIIILYIIVL